MKNLKAKSILFSLSAIMAIAVFMTSCEQQELFSELPNNIDDDFNSIYNQSGTNEVQFKDISINIKSGILHFDNYEDQIYFENEVAKMKDDEIKSLETRLNYESSATQILNNIESLGKLDQQNLPKLSELNDMFDNIIFTYDKQEEAFVIENKFIYQYALNDKSIVNVNGIYNGYKDDKIYAGISLDNVVSSMKNNKPIDNSVQEIENIVNNNYKNFTNCSNTNQYLDWARLRLSASKRITESYSICDPNDPYFEYYSDYCDLDYTTRYTYSLKHEEKIEFFEIYLYWKRHTVDNMGGSIELMHSGSTTSENFPEITASSIYWSRTFYNNDVGTIINAFGQCDSMDGDAVITEECD